MSSAHAKTALRRLHANAQGKLIRCEPTHPLNLVNAQGHIAEHATDDETLFHQWLGQGLSLEEFETRLTKGALEHTRGNVSQAARLMGLSRAQMMYRVDKLKQ
ncbi:MULTISPECIES: helix-turn-helix domain-containing protein [Pseudomonas]|uniref:TmbR n=1 Tax=Pseudomonas putida ND6 TaxID=231023 RepID=I3V4R3_PSEPU|nr:MULTISPECIES: helix-turn-helix domain-containing protein [Pseudomonas]AFK72734.1 TmbR [Pseudomonas putida ND6]